MASHEEPHRDVPVALVVEQDNEQQTELAEQEPLMRDSTEVKTAAEFKHGFWSCFGDWKFCCLAAWPCTRPLLWAETMHNAKLLSFGSGLLMYGVPWAVFWIFYTSWEPARENYGLSLSSWVISAVGSLAWVAWVVIGCVYRGKLREKYGLGRSPIMDLFAHWCCSCCAVTQEARQVAYKEGVHHL